MSRLLPVTAALAALLGFSPAHAATPPDTLIVAISLDGVISLDPAESFETVSTGSLVDIYQGLVASDRQDFDYLSDQLESLRHYGKTAALVAAA